MRTPARSTTMRVYRNAATQALATVITGVVGFALTPVLLITAGRSEYGLWVLSQTFSATSGFMAIFGLGLQAAIVRLVAESPEDDGGRQAASIVRSAFRTYAWLGGLAALSMVAFGETIGVRVFRIPAGQVETARVIFAIAAAQGLVEYLGWAHSAALEGWQRYDIARTLELIRLFGFAAVAIVLVRGGHGAVGLALATLGGAALRSAGAVAVVARHLPAGPFGGGNAPRGSDGHHLRLFRLARPFSLLNLIGIAYNLTGRTVISTMVGVASLADYDVITKVTTLASIPANVLPAVMPAAGAQLHARGEALALRRLFFRTTRHNLYVSLFVASTLMLLAPEILRLWVGGAYVRLDTPLRIYLSQHLLSPAVLVGYALAIGFGAVAPLVRIAVVSTAVTIVASIVLTRLLGFPGTLIGTVVGAAVVLPIYLRYLQSAFDVTLAAIVRESLIRPYALTAAYVAAAAVFIAPASLHGLPGLAAKGGICGIVFAALVWTLGVDHDERRQALLWIGGIKRRVFGILGGGSERAGNP